MLLRSSSTPILNSWLQAHYSRPSSVQELSSDPPLQLTRTKSLSFPTSSESPENSNHPKHNKNNHHIPQPHQKTPINVVPSVQHQERSKPSKISSSLFSSIQRLFSSSGLGNNGDESSSSSAVKREEGVLQTLLLDGDDRTGSNGVRLCGVGGSDGRGGGGRGDDVASGFYDSNNNHGRSDSTDAYYQKMIAENPKNGLLLGNYAKFLKEVRGDLAKAEEYCGRAILENHDDAKVLSLYADIIWEREKNHERTESYFDQAVKTSPDDCYVLASYARFLWDCEEEEEEEEIKGRNQNESFLESSSSSPPNNNFLPRQSSLTAAY